MTKLGKLGLGLAMLSLISFVASKSILNGWMPFLWVQLGLTVFFFVLTAYFERHLLVDFFTTKTTKNGMNMGVMILLVLVVLILVNVLSIRNYKTFDMTQARLNSLSDQSIKVVKALDDEVKVRLFYQKGMEGIDQAKDRFRRAIRLYQDVSEKVTLEFVDMDEKPKLVEEYGVNKGTGLAFVEYKGRRNRVEKFDDEQELTNAMIKATREKDKIIYWAQGAGEADMADTTTREGAGLMKAPLEAIRFSVKTLNLNTSPKIPDDADVLAIVGPKQDYFPPAIAAIEAYLARGGSVLLALEPKREAGLAPLLAKMGLMVSNKFSGTAVQDISGKMVVEPKAPVIGFSASQSSELVKNISPNEYMQLKQPQALIRLTETPANITYEDLIKTYQGTVQVDSLADLENPAKIGAPSEFNVATSLKGKFPGAADGKEFMAVVTGDADLYNNLSVSQKISRDFAYNTFAYLGKETDLISIAPKDPAVTAMTLTPTKSFMMLGYVFLMPFALLIAGIVFFVKRRSA